MGVHWWVIVRIVREPLGTQGQEEALRFPSPCRNAACDAALFTGWPKAHTPLFVYQLVLNLMNLVLGLISMTILLETTEKRIFSGMLKRMRVPTYRGLISL